MAKEASQTKNSEYRRRRISAIQYHFSLKSIVENIGSSGKSLLNRNDLPLSAR